MGIIRWDRPRGAVHDLARALSYGEDGCHVLLVSDAALMVLQNWAALDLEFKARWADSIADNGFYPISDESANYGDWVDLCERIKSELVPVTCDITASIDALTAQVEAIATTLAGWTIPESVDPAATNAKLDAIAAAVRDQQLCCGSIADTPYWPETPVETANPETSTFCDRCWSVVRDWQDSSEELCRKWIAGEGLGVGVLALLLAFFFPPLSVLLAVLAIVSQVVLDVAEGDLNDDLDAMVPDLVCAIYSSGNSTAAKAALDEVLDAGPYPEGWPALGTTVLKNIFTVEALNRVFNETYTIRGDSSGSSCATCVPPGGMLITNYESPYNTILVGDTYSGGQSNNSSNGWLSGDGSPTYFYFTPDDAVATFDFDYDIMSTAPENWTVGELRIRRTSDNTQVGTVNADVRSFGNGTWHNYTGTCTAALTSGVQYYLFAAGAGGNSFWIRDIIFLRAT